MLERVGCIKTLFFLPFLFFMLLLIWIMALLSWIMKNYIALNYTFHEKLYMDLFELYFQVHLQSDFQNLLITK